MIEARESWWVARWSPEDHMAVEEMYELTEGRTGDLTVEEADAVLRVMGLEVAS